MKRTSQTKVMHIEFMKMNRLKYHPLQTWKLSTFQLSAHVISRIEPNLASEKPNGQKVKHH